MLLEEKSFDSPASKGPLQGKHHPVRNPSREWEHPDLEEANRYRGHAATWQKKGTPGPQNPEASRWN